MKWILFVVVVLGLNCFVQAQLPRKVQKLEGTWAYKAGSGFERWNLVGDVLEGESFRVNKLGDTIIAERMQIKSINKRLMLHLEAFHIIGDSLHVRSRDLIGKRKKMEFTGIQTVDLETLTYKTALFSKKKLYIYILRKGSKKPQKLILSRQEND